MNRRNVLMGLGTIVVGGGAALGSGAFSTVEANRTVTIDTASDSNALIALKPGSSDYVTNNSGQIEIDLSESNLGDASGVNVDATITINDAFVVENNADFSVDITFTDDSDDVTLTVTPENPNLSASASDDTDQRSFDLEIDTEDAAVDSTFDATLTVTATNTS